MRNKPALRTAVAAAFMAAFAIVACAPRASGQNKVPEVPYVPTPHDVVQSMLRTAGVGPDDVVYDLGSGDGRIVIAAVRDFGARRAVGVDIDPVRVRDGRRNAWEAGVADRTEFHEGNVLEFDFSAATVVAMYLLPDINLRLRPRLLAELRPGTRIVSNAFHMGRWRPDRTVRAPGRAVYFWVVPARVEGSWRLEIGKRSYGIALKQDFQRVSGRLTRGGTEAELQDGRLSGDRLRFAARLPGRVLRFDLRATAPGRMEGAVTGGGESRPVIGQRAP